MKRFAVWLLVLLCCLTAGCSQAPAKQEQAPSAPEAVTFTDDLGREVTAAAPKRVVAMIGSFADIWCLAGGKDTLAATAHDAWTSFDLGLSESVTDIGSSKDPNLELILAAEPDFVIASANTGADVELLDTFESAGINAAYFEVSTVEQYLRMLEICAKITGKPENFEKYGRSVLEQCERAKQRADGTQPTALYVRVTGSSCKVKNSRDSVLGEMLKDLQCVNIADSEESLLEELSMELIVKEDPDFIFVVFQGGEKEEAKQALDQTLLSNPAWQGLKAVREGQFHILDEKLYNLKPNEKWGQAYEDLAAILYPD